MRGMRPAKNPKARSSYVPRKVNSRRRRSDEDFETNEEDLLALDECDGTETGALAEFCQEDSDADGEIGMRVSLSFVFFTTRSYFYIIA